MNTKDISYYMTLPYNMIVEIVESNPPYYFGIIQELPGCFANGKTEIELREKMEKAKNKYFDKLFQQEELIHEPGDMTLRVSSGKRVGQWGYALFFIFLIQFNCMLNIKHMKCCHCFF